MDPRALKQTLLRELSRHPFRAPWWALSRHAQTAWGPLLRPFPRFSLRLERVPTPDGDFLRTHHLDGRPGAPVVLLLHGLEGCLVSHYIMGLLDRIRGLGWSAVVLEFRGCGGELNKARRLYHSGETSDLDFIVNRIAEEDPCRRLYLVGFSLGGNVAAKWLGEKGEDAPVTAAAAVSSPFDLSASAIALETSLGGYYGRRFLETLLPKAIEKARQYPGVYDPARLRGCRSLVEYDDVVTAPLHGFDGVWDYYDKSSCLRYLSRIRRPTLFLASEDDPMIPAWSLPRALCDRSPWLIPRFTRRGGHLGFVTGPSPLTPRYWAEEQIMRFLGMCEASH